MFGNIKEKFKEGDKKDVKKNLTIRNQGQSAPILKIDPGEYQLHLFIEETRGLENPELKSESLDPLIRASIFDEVKTAGPKSKIGSGQIYWGDHMFFTKKIEDQRYLFSQKLKIEILNYHKIGRNSLVGEISLDLASIFNEPKHCLLHQWAGLSNLLNNFEEIKGFIKFSVTFTGEKDEPIVLEKERMGEKKDRKYTMHIGTGGATGAEVLLAPQLKTKGHQMKVTVIKGDQFMKLDLIGSIDSYLILEFGTARFQTEPIANNRNPFYGIAIYLPYSEPSINEFLRIVVMDFDMGKKDDVLGTLIFKKSDILNGNYKEICWFDIYGSQSDSTNDFGDIMNNDSSLGAFWKGRLMLGIESYPCEKPRLLCERLDGKIVEKYREGLDLELQVLAEIHHAFSLPKENASYSIQIRWADKEMNFSEKKSQKSFCEFLQRKNQSFKFPYPSTGIKTFPDIIIYLCLNGKRVSYYRGSVDQFLSPVPAMKARAPQLLYLKPEKSEAPDIRQDLAGVLKIRVGIISDSLAIDEIFKAWDANFQRAESKPGVLITNLYHCKDLIPSDEEGTSDPFIVVSYNGNEARSSVIDKSLNPIWNERFHLKIPIMMKKGTANYEDSIIFLKIFDKDSIKLLDTEVYSTDEFIGSGIVSIQKAKEQGFLVFNQQEICCRPSWISLDYNGSYVGKILVSFNILEYDYKIPMEIEPFEPHSERFTIKIRILGLRNLKSSGILSVQKAFLKFDMNGFKRIGLKKDSLIVNAPETGSNPNFCTIVKFDADLPIDPTLCPSLTCLVFDTVWEGLIQPVIGSFAIDLGDVMANDEELMKKPHKMQSNFILKHPEVLRGETDDIVLDVDSEKKTLLKKDKTKDDKKNENTIINEMMIKKTKKYPPVLTENGELNQEFMIIKPRYVKAPKKQFMTENEVPDPECYLGLGHDKREDKFKNQSKRHYRFYVQHELETTKFMNQQLFNHYSIFKGKRKFEEDLFDALSFEQQMEEVGLFKGLVNIMRGEELKKPLISDMKEEPKSQYDELDALILHSERFLVRVYVLDALNLQPMDLDSLSDPYVRIILGDTKLDNREEYKKDQTNVGIFKLFELNCKLPGPSQLRIQVWDYDLLKNDDLIGETIIDLENRHFSKKWRSLKQKPIETRVLRQPTSSLPRGKIRLWLELIPLESIEKTPKWFIEPKPQQEFEIRAVIWECKNVPARDQEGTSDIYVVGRLGEQSFQTDTHFRSKDGFGSFNWRMVWRVKLPMKDNSITFQIWDQDFMTQDDFIAEATVDFSKQAESAYENDAIAKIFGPKFIGVANSLEKMVEKWVNPKEHVTIKTNEIFKIELTNIDKEGFVITQKKKKKGGKGKISKATLRLSFEILPLEYALKTPVGTGRNEPNNNPWLPPPLERYSLGIDPSGLLNNVITPEVKAKLILGAVGVFCGCVCLLFIVTFLAGLTANAAI